MRNIRERKRQRLLKARTIRLPNIGYMPRKAKMSETIDMPELSTEEARAAFVRPFRFVKPSP